jgi:hypothetical protein
MTPEQTAIRQWLSKLAPQFGACGCLGPGEGEPLCYCIMAMVENVEGSYYQIFEHRSPDGITHEAKLLGPVGGPYVAV